MELEIGGRIFKSETRYLFDLKPVLAFPEELEKMENFPAYEMFRDVYLSKSDREKIIEHSVRYDLTFTSNGKIGKEFLKTYGHYHPEVEKGLTYPEIYEILEGNAYFILQKPVRDDELEDVIVVTAKEGDKVIIPPNYGHVMINPTNKNLKSCNWVYSKFSSLYEPYTKMRGAGYYYTDDGWVENQNYSRLPEIRFVKPRLPKELGLKRSDEIYKLIKTPEKLEFLYKPSEYIEIFEEAFKDD
jgi:glucose-6-phosphate isomerase